MTYKGILFDFDGVVINSMHQHFSAWEKAFAEQGITIFKEDFFLLEGQGVGTIAQILGEQNSLTEQQILDVVSNKVRHYYKSVKIEFYDNFLEMISTFKKKNIPMAVVTGGNRERVEIIIREYLEDIFLAVVTIDDVQKGKPHPEPFLKGAGMLNLRPQECIVVENAPLGIKAAKAAGCSVIAIKTTLDEKHLADADFICADFTCVINQIDILLNQD
jgi:HAD superfamily hydrolase (TIGR01509 family)